ncbi:MAG: hypothetical protein HQM16_09645 [Deltaproteobacteria bacterium]|nr:hypothetical protein [Deltaproteobacteria bacterium]
MNQKEEFLSSYLRGYQTSGSWLLRFHDLMHFRVREILLLATKYDAFILGEDGRLAERLFVEYSGLNLSSAPRITYVSTGEEALKLLSSRHFDLVMTMARFEDSNVNDFGRKVKEIDPQMPVVLLVFNENDLATIPGGINKKAVDHSFLWRGDARILLTIIKIIEDSFNAPHDVKVAGIKAILVVEDSVRYYSSFLTVLYTVVMAQSQSLISEGLNDLHKLFRMRARPKIFLATSYEDALDLYHTYKDQVMAVISDVSLPRGSGATENNAGFDLVKTLAGEDPMLSLMLQSSKSENLEQAKSLGINYVDKNSPHLLKKIRHFVFDSLGLGSFAFKYPNGLEIARAKDVKEMEKLIKTIPAESIEYHSKHNHFSTWFYARSMFSLADKLKKLSVADFKDIEEMREYFIKSFRLARKQEQQGVIADFSTGQVGPENPFIRMGTGSIGGKGRGIAFINSLFARYGLHERISNLEITIPQTVALGTDEFEKFMLVNNLYEEIDRLKTDQEIVQRFIVGKLSEEHWDHLKFVLNNMTGPIAVRSSSILEDSQFQPFAGIYSTYMLPNNHPDPNVRFLELCRAIKAVYASLYFKNAQSYRAGTAHSREEESMAIVIQQVIGQQYGNRYYPLISGVAQSYNFYPIGHQKAEDGIAQIVLGLGHAVVQGAAVLRFSPNTPEVLPQFSKPADYLKYTQKKFYALNLARATIDFTSSSDDESLDFVDIEQAEADGSLKHVASVYCADDDAIRENFNLSGPRILTFNHVLKYNQIPLAGALAELLPAIKNEVGFPIEIEFALDQKGSGDPVLYILQMRPLASQVLSAVVDLEGYDDKDIICRTAMALGHGTFQNIRDIVFIKNDTLDFRKTSEIAGQVGMINEGLQKEKRPYFLVGPGRWGSSDPSLGIPIKWCDITGACLIAETPLFGHMVEPSQGTHFFQNIVSKGVGYLTLSNKGESTAIGSSFLDTAWINAQPVQWEGEFIRHVRLHNPISAHLDGRKGRAVVVRQT